MTAPFPEANFIRLSAGQAIMMTGDWLRTVALLTAGYALAPGPLVVCALMLCALVPAMWVPRVEACASKRLMIWIDLLRGLLTLCMWGGIVTGQVWVACLFLVMASALGGVYERARALLLTAVVPADRLGAVGGVYALLHGLTMLVGALVGGWLTVVMGAETVLLLAAGAAGVSVLSLLTVQAAPQKGGVVRGEGTRRQVRAGWRYVRARPELWRLFVLQALRDFCAAGVLLFVVLFLVAEDRGAMGLGMGYALIAVAGVAGAVVMRRFLGRQQVEEGDFFRIYLPVQLLYGLLLGVLFDAGSWQTLLTALCVLTFCQAAADAYVERALQAGCGHRSRERVLALYRLVSRVSYLAALLLITVVTFVANITYKM